MTLTCKFIYGFFQLFLYLHTWYTGDYSSFSFLLDTLCLLVLILDNIKWKVKGDYSSWVSNHKRFCHYPYSNYRNSYFTYVTVTIVQFMQPFPQTIKCRMTRLVHKGIFFLHWCGASMRRLSESLEGIKSQTLLKIFLKRCLLGLW